MTPKMIDSNCPADSVSGEDQDLPSIGVRLQVYLAHAGATSRRKAIDLVDDGRVQVNGIVATAVGQRILPQDLVLLDGKPVKLETVKRYILLNKPAGYVCSMADEKGRPVAVDLVKGDIPERVYNVGRLDMFSQGGLLFTNDGDFAARVGHPSSGIEKEYIVETTMPLTPGIAERFQKGIRIAGSFYRALSARELSSRRLNIVLVEGKNREIRRVLSFFDVSIRRLTRIRIGPVLLGDLPIGAWRPLTAVEISGLCAGEGEIKRS